MPQPTVPASVLALVGIATTDPFLLLPHLLLLEPRIYSLWSSLIDKLDNSHRVSFNKGWKIMVGAKRLCGVSICQQPRCRGGSFSSGIEDTLTDVEQRGTTSPRKFLSTDISPGRTSAGPPGNGVQSRDVGLYGVACGFITTVWCNIVPRNWTRISLCPEMTLTELQIRSPPNAMVKSPKSKPVCYVFCSYTDCPQLARPTIGSKCSRVHSQFPSSYRQQRSVKGWCLTSFASIRTYKPLGTLK